MHWRGLGIGLLAPLLGGTVASAAATGPSAPIIPQAAVIATLDAFHAALEQQDLDAATALVIADGRMAEVPGDVPGQALESGSWQESLWLFIKPESDGARQRIEQQFKPLVIVDGKAAFLRQAILLHHPQSQPLCRVEHVQLIKVAEQWRIYNLTLLDRPDACFTANGY